MDNAQCRMPKGRSSKEMQVRKGRYHYLLYIQSNSTSSSRTPLTNSNRHRPNQCNSKHPNRPSASHGHLEAVYKRRQTALAQLRDFMTACQVCLNRSRLARSTTVSRSWNMFEMLRLASTVGIRALTFPGLLGLLCLPKTCGQ